MPKGAILPEETQPARAQEAASYTLVAATLDAIDPQVLADWQGLPGSPQRSPMHDPAWLKGYFEGQTNNLLVYALYQSGELKGIAPFLRRDWPLKWHLGEMCVGTFPLTRLRLLGGPLLFPPDEAAYDLLFQRVLSDGGFDCLFLEEIPVDSFSWEYLDKSTLVRSSFVRHQPDAPSLHPILRIEGTFEQYMRKFSSKHRNTLQRKVRKLRESPFGEMRLARYESVSEVAPFLEQAVEISRKTYQWQMHQRGLSATDLLRQRLEFAAAHDWMRCYLLFCGARAVAFIVGYQYEGTFLLDEIGHDPELAKYSAGAVLQLLCVEDLFQHKRASIFDLQDYARYKDELSNENYLQGRMFLFRRGMYPAFLRAGDRACSGVTAAVSSVLDRVGLKSKVRKAIRALRGSS